MHFIALSFIITLQLLRYDLNNVKRDVKHQTSIVIFQVFWGASNEYPQHMLLWRNKKKYPRSITKYFSLTIPLYLLSIQLATDIKLLEH